ncbi:hypothetical protein ACBR40_28445 [Nonomuraea sp. AD125B]|uniref:hypothetical protein n=1 Tax=Nonomuraea sp. AD125B TaxID=3242897 RepID=UPI003527EB28
MSEQAVQAIVGNEQAEVSWEVVSPPTKKPAGARAVPKWETDARDCVRAAIRRHSKPLTDLIARDAN